MKMKQRIAGAVAALAFWYAHSAHATAWVERHDMSAATFQTEHQRWTGAPYDLRPMCISGYIEGGQLRYAATWEKKSGEWYSTNGVTAAQFTALNATMNGQGLWPVFISGFVSGGVRYYNAIWEYQRAPVGSVAASVGLTRAGLTGDLLSKISQGFVLAYVSTFTENGTDMYAAIYSKNVSGSSVQCGYGQTFAQYQTEFGNMTSQGFRLAAHTVSLEGGVERVSTVYRKPSSAGWWAYASLSEKNFEAETLNAYYTGYRPAFVSVYTNNNASLYSAVWTYNGGMTGGEVAPIFNAINSYMTTNNVPGLSLSISRNGRLLWARGFGYADQANGELVHPHNRFRIASVSKPVTATAMLKLRDGGQLTSISNKVFGTGALLGNTYGTTAYSVNEKAISVQNLLTHTTGWTNDGQLWNNAYASNHAAIIGWQLDNANQSAAPGVNYQYMNTDFCVAARVIEKLSNTNYEAYVKKAVLAPCGITDMEIGAPTLAGRKANEVVYYQGSNWNPYVVIDPRRMDANGGWIAKPNDLLLLMRRLDGNPINTDIISSNRLVEMLSPLPSSQSYGLGMFGIGSGYGHNGCMVGTRSFLVHRADGIDYAVALNIDVVSDSCTWNLRAGIDAAISSIPTNAWPDYDLFSAVSTEYDAWAASNLPSYLLSKPGMKEDFWGPEADPDGDGLKNLFEAYFNFNPMAASPNPFHYAKENGDFVTRWWLPLFSSQNGVQLSSEFKLNFESAKWQPGPVVQIGSPAGTLETRTPTAAKSRMFQRIKAIAP